MHDCTLCALQGSQSDEDEVGGAVVGEGVGAKVSASSFKLLGILYRVFNLRILYRAFDFQSFYLVSNLDIA